jgi:hypothetical protein
MALEKVSVAAQDAGGWLRNWYLNCYSDGISCSLVKKIFWEVNISSANQQISLIL